MGGKHNKACCDGPCLTFSDDFNRADSTDLGSDWTECVGDWSIVSGQLTAASSGAVVVLNHKASGTVGILRGYVQFSGCTGCIYRIYVFYGSSGTPCSGGSDYIIEIEILSDSTAELRMLGGADTVTADLDIGEETGLNWSVCVSNDSIEFESDALDTTMTSAGPFPIICNLTITHYWFALGHDTATQGYWDNIEYSDHFDHNPNCPKCRPAACFPLDVETVIGFDFLIEGIGNGSSCSCASSFSFQLLIRDTHDPCGTPYQSEVETLIFPDTGSPFCTDQTFDWIVYCDETGISVALTVIPDLGTEASWFMTFPLGTLAAAIAVTSEPVTDPGDGRVCDYGSATLTMTPILSDNCCGTAS